LANNIVAPEVDVKPESKAALGEMAKLLQKDAALKVNVVARNIDLSQKRAESVIRALTFQR
jgi:OmpA-OmpF porin, OOP family